MCSRKEITRSDIKLDGDILERDDKHVESIYGGERNNGQSTIGEIYEGGTYYRKYEIRK